MRVAALYDIHGNDPALEAVLTDVERHAPDAIVAGGDVVSGPLPAETLERLLALGNVVHWVAGNADREVVKAHDRGATLRDALNAPDPSEQAAAWAAAHLDRSARDVLAGLPSAAVIELDRYRSGT